jgi:hypothetical protein
MQKVLSSIAVLSLDFCLLLLLVNTLELQGKENQNSCLANQFSKRKEHAVSRMPKQSSIEGDVIRLRQSLRP